MPFAAIDTQALYQVRRDFYIWRQRSRPLGTDVENAIEKVLEAIKVALRTQLGNQDAWNAAIADLRFEFGLICCLFDNHPGFHTFALQQENFLAKRGVL
jgi:hypothetical protein